MNITNVQNNLNILAVHLNKVKVESDKNEIKTIEEEQLLAVENAEKAAHKAEGVNKDVIIANIDAASINPELINNIKLFRFHTESDYLKTAKETGKNINVYSTSNN